MCLLVFLTQRRPHFLCCRLLPLILIPGERSFIVRQVRQKSKPSDTFLTYFLFFDNRRSVEKLAQIIPVEFAPACEFLHQLRRIESVAGLPELQNKKSPDQGLIERATGEGSQIMNVARLAALIACP